MLNELHQIEANYGCYAEYCRSREEKEERDYKLFLERESIYEKNREKLKTAKCVLWYGNEGRCDKCPHADFDTQRDSDDDMDLIICNAPADYVCKDRDYAMLPLKYSVIGQKISGNDSFMEQLGLKDEIRFDFKLKKEADEFLNTECKNGIYRHHNGNTYRMTLTDYKE